MNVVGFPLKAKTITFCISKKSSVKDLALPTFTTTKNGKF